MSWENALSADWICPTCKIRQKGLIYIRYGAQSETLEIGENIKWGKASEADLVKRLPNDTGFIEGWTNCRNESCGRVTITIKVEIKDNEIVRAQAV
jgi:hypothetical protein